MRNLIAVCHISLDGVIQGPGGPKEDTSGGFTRGGWISGYGDEVLGSTVRAQMAMPFDLLLGRKTYEIWAAYWPEHGEVWPNANAATKYVASNTMTAGSWQPATVLAGDVAEQVAALKQSEGPDLHVYGSADLLQALIKQNLVDAFWLKIYPLTLGTGKRLFAGGTVPARFEVTESQVSPSGVFLVNYSRKA